MLDGLEAIEAAPRVVSIGGERLELRPLVLAQLPAMARLVEPVAQLLASLRGIPEGEDLLVLVAGLLQATGDALPRAAALATGRPFKWIALRTLPEMAALCVAILSQNQDFFLHGLRAPAKRPALRGARAAPQKWTLADSFQCLQERGHSRVEILGYTVAQFEAFLEAAVRARRRELCNLAMCARAAQFDKSGFASVLKEIEAHG